MGAAAATYRLPSALEPCAGGRQGRHTTATSVATATPVPSTLEAEDAASPAVPEGSVVASSWCTAGITNAKTLDLSTAFNGRRLCESTVGLYEEKGLTSWTQAGAVDKTEWVNQIRTVSTCCSSSPYYIQESLHPNYWAQLATRSCVRQAWNGGVPRGGKCSISGTGLLNGEPRMSLS